MSIVVYQFKVEEKFELIEIVFNFLTRMVATYKKLQMTYITSTDTVKLVEKSPTYDNILISVASAPQCETKEESGLLAFDETTSTEGNESMHFDDTLSEQNQ